MSEYLGQHRPPAWEFRPSPADGSGGWLRIGHRAFAVRDIASVVPRARLEPNIDGHLLMVSLFMLAGLAFVLPVAMELARTRFLIGGVLFVGIGLMGIAEILRRRPTSLYHLDIELRDGTCAVFSTAEPSELLALHSVLEQRLGAGQPR